MRSSLIELLACPQCKADISLKQAEGGSTDEIERGELGCAQCGARYPIEQGIPRLLPSTLLDAQKDEIAARDAQVGDYDRMWYLSLFGKVEVPMTLRRLHPCKSERVLEAGCGTGRMTRALASRVGELIAIDFSFESLRVGKKKLDAASVKNVHVVQADLCNLPFKDSVFDKGLSCQVLEHIPTHDARKKAVSSLKRVLNENAAFVVSAYQFSVFTKEKEGRHEGGIPFFRFTQKEFRELLGTEFSVESITGALIYLYLARCSCA